MIDVSAGQHCRERQLMRATMRRKPSADRLTYDVEEAGIKLGIGGTQAYEAAKNGELPTIRIGKRLLVPKAALDRMLADRADAG
jgi:excisionase family DNA binding protein